MSSKALFVFPSASGHINPSFPLCQRLADLGWEVAYLGIPEFRESIAAAGGKLFDVNELGKEFGIEDVRAMIVGTVADYGPSAKPWALNFGSLALEKLLPMYIAFLRRFAPQLVVYCPVLSHVAHFAAGHLGIPDVSLLTAAGPGYWDAAFAVHGGSAGGLVDAIKANSANAAAIEGVRTLLQRPELSLNTSEPLVNEYYTAVNLVTTVPFLADKLNEKDEAFYESAGKKFEFVGPLLGSRPLAPESEDFLRQVEVSRGRGQEVVYVSMGTAITGSHPDFGWYGTAGSAVTGKELCQAVFRAVFAELATTALMNPAPVIVISTGGQPDALEDIIVPANAICAPSLPQVELLRRAKPALFVTHGGQNSFMESLTVGTPMLFCPGFGDQLATAAKAERLGLGLKVDRPPKQEQASSEAIASYEAAVARGLRRMLGAERAKFTSAAQMVVKELSEAGGVERALQICLQTAAAGKA
ncbi:yjiC [Symbiodinium natans]|uniref:YjiC protein n=1 Tax=Symbiodinium natans TaxID=878477 RepID=A0A812PXK1_9DINO|nr:yjiC [Symbiodinium natans]